jgi:hypothetical protein
MEYNVHRAAYALNHVLDSQEFFQTWEQIDCAVKRKDLAVFDGDFELEPLNELVSIGVQSRRALQNLRQMVTYRKRARDDYQRNFLENIRRIERKALLVEEFFAFSTKPFDIQDRREFFARQHALWGASKACFLAARDASSWDKRCKLIREFWQSVVTDLVDTIRHFSITPRALN